MQPVVSQADGSMQFNQKNAGGHTIDNSHANQLSNGQANSLDIGSREATETAEKVFTAFPHIHLSCLRSYISALGAFSDLKFFCCLSMLANLISPMG